MAPALSEFTVYQYLLVYCIPSEPPVLPFLPQLQYTQMISPPQLLWTTGLVVFLNLNNLIPPSQIPDQSFSHNPFLHYQKANYPLLSPSTKTSSQKHLFPSTKWTEHRHPVLMG